MNLCANSTFPNSIEITFSKLLKLEQVKEMNVILEGTFIYSFEDVALYGDINNHNEPGIWIELRNSTEREDSLYKKLHNKKIVIAGTMTTNRKGHLSSYFGTLYDIACIIEKK